MIDIAALATNLQLKDDGIYYSSQTSAISYPEDGNENFMQIEDNSFWFRHRNDVISAAVKKFNHGKLFFDVGGGNGFVAKGLQEAGEQVVLIEPGNRGALNAKKRNIQNVVCSTLEDAGFKKESMDSIGMFDVVEHIEDDVSFLKSAYNYLKPDGLLFITVPAFQALWSDEDDVAGHYRRYTRRSMQEVLKGAGFNIHYSTYIFSILPLPVLLFRSIPSRLGFRKKESTRLEHNKNEHQMKRGMIGEVLKKIWNYELLKVKAGGHIPVGGSFFIVAKRTGS